MNTTPRATTPEHVDQLFASGYNHEYVEPQSPPYSGLQPRVCQAAVSTTLRAKTPSMSSRSEHHTANQNPSMLSGYDLHTAEYNPEYVEP